jgi:hypothetical protein
MAEVNRRKGGRMSDDSTQEVSQRIIEGMGRGLTEAVVTSKLREQLKRLVGSDVLSILEAELGRGREDA